MPVPTRALALATLTFAAAPAVAQNQVLVLDGVGDYAHASGLAGLSGVTEYTLEAWVRSDGQNLANKLIDMGQDPNQRIGIQATCPDGPIEVGEEWGLGTGAALVYLTNDLCDSGWHHVAKTSDGVEQRLFVDGDLVATAPALGLTFAFDGKQVGIGSHVVPGHDLWRGAIDDVRIWRRALSPAEIQSPCPGATPASTLDLVSWWRFDGDGLDSVGSNDAGLFGSPTFEPLPCPTLTASPDELSVSAGGAVEFALCVGPVSPASVFLLLGSASGTLPGIQFEGFTVPLALDGYALLSLAKANKPPYTNSLGILTLGGKAKAFLTVPAATDPALAGVTLHHAAIVWDTHTKPTDPTVVHVTNSVALALVP